MFDLTGKTALVTGASGGIGGAIAKSLHAQGATLVLSGTRAEALEALKGELASRAHTERVNAVVAEALGGRIQTPLDAVAVTRGPGLIGCLLVGAADFGGALCPLDLVEPVGVVGHHDPASLQGRRPLTVVLRVGAVR